MQIGHMTQDGSHAYSLNIPQFGLGVFLMSEPGECKSSVLEALKAGYTHIDTASMYANEHEVGQALKGPAQRVHVRHHSGQRLICTGRRAS